MKILERLRKRKEAEKELKRAFDTLMLELRFMRFQFDNLKQVEKMYEDLDPNSEDYSWRRRGADRHIAQEKSDLDFEVELVVAALDKYYDMTRS